MEEYIRLEEEKARRRRKVYNWKTAAYGKIWCDEDIHDLRSVETEFSAIVFNDALTSEVELSCEPTVSPLNDNKIDFRISSDESDDENYTRGDGKRRYRDSSGDGVMKFDDGGSDSLSAFESSEYKKGETNGKSSVGGEVTETAPTSGATKGSAGIMGTSVGTSGITRIMAGIKLKRITRRT
uniref:Uncharacterized protein n=1 Tax=Tanacetum cinerariifolium TaxID=118510 RepID=A0A6L2NZ14_TANCI|nr:hypothetical protein [Tanacetum cinerariifolium]